MEHKFQINLRGIIELLSQHLYSGPHVFLRELLQNGVDAIRARRYAEPDHAGEITLEIVEPRPPKPPTLVFMDNGIGLTEDEIHRFLATIGQSSKRSDLWDRPTDFLGQFGIGLLSCFVVADEIVVLTRSAKEQSPPMEWRGRPDGTYTIKTLQRDIAPGTQVYLTGKSDKAEYFTADRIAELTWHYGGLLPYPIRLTTGHHTRLINDEPAPWRQRFANSAKQTEALMEYGQRMFETRFFDCIPLHSDVGGVDGVAYVLPYTPNLAGKRSHRVYLKNMLLSENAENLLPEWAFFVKCAVNVEDLRPTASRESFYEDDALAQTRDHLGDCLRDYLIQLAQSDKDRLRALIGLHYLAIKALAVQDDEFYKIFIDYLPFETSMGEMTLAEYREENDTIRYVSNLDQFRQIARVAAAQSMCVINGAYTYNTELLEKYGDVFPEEQVEAVDPTSLAQNFEELSHEEQETVFELVRLADEVLQPFRCEADMKRFEPGELPTLYTTGADANFLRSVEQSRDVADSLWGGVLDNLSQRSGDGMVARLCFNYNNELIRKVASLKNRELMQRSIQMLYIQALLLGHHPLSAREMKLLNDGLLGLIEWGVENQ